MAGIINIVQNKVEMKSHEKVFALKNDWQDRQTSVIAQVHILLPWTKDDGSQSNSKEEQLPLPFPFLPEGGWSLPWSSSDFSDGVGGRRTCSVVRSHTSNKSEMSFRLCSYVRNLQMEQMSLL